MKTMISRSIRRSESPLLFPPCLPRKFPPAVLKVGDRVKIRERDGFGVGTVISFDPDGRLVRVSFISCEGWWSRSDLRKVDHGQES